MIELKAEHLNYYHWEDIREFLCEAMGIDKAYFRDYHKLVGGEYKDFWHIWTEYFDQDVRNDSFSKVFLDLSVDYLDYIVGDRARYGVGDTEWIRDIKPAIDKLREVLGEEIIILYSW